MSEHRIEKLEAEIRFLRQCLRNLAQSVIAGDGKAEDLAEKAHVVLAE